MDHASCRSIMGSATTAHALWHLHCRGQKLFGGLCLVMNSIEMSGPPSWRQGAPSNCRLLHSFSLLQVYFLFSITFFISSLGNRQDLDVPERASAALRSIRKRWQQRKQVSLCDHHRQQWEDLVRMQKVPVWEIFFLWIWLIFLWRGCGQQRSLGDQESLGHIILLIPQFQP